MSCEARHRRKLGFGFGGAKRITALAFSDFFSNDLFKDQCVYFSSQNTVFSHFHPLERTLPAQMQNAVYDRPSETNEIIAYSKYSNSILKILGDVGMGRSPTSNFVGPSPAAPPLSLRPRRLVKTN